MIVATCPVCEKKYKVRNKYAGRELACKQCRSTVKVPEMEEGESFGFSNYVPRRKVTRHVIVKPEKQNTESKSWGILKYCGNILACVILLVMFVFSRGRLHHIRDIIDIAKGETKPWGVVVENLIFYSVVIMIIIGLFAVVASHQ